MRNFQLKNRFKKITFFSLLSLGMLSSCTEKTPPPASLSGTIKDSETEQAISEARITIGNQWMQTAGDGFYSFPEIGAGNYSIEVTHPDYDVYKNSVPLKDHDVVHDVRLSLKKYSFSGTVTDSRTNEALSGVTVKPSVGPEKVTGPDGKYTIEDLKKGSISITFSKAGYREKTEQASIPDVSSLNTKLELYTTTLTGTITDNDTGNAISGVTVTLSPGGHSATTGSGGTYSFENLTQTSYSLAASKSGYTAYSATVPLTLTTPTHTHSFKMTSTGPGPALVTITSTNIVISDGVNLSIAANASASQFIHRMYQTSQVSSLSDDAVINLLKTIAPVEAKPGTWSFYNLNASTAYTYCAVAIGPDGRYGKLTKQSYTTKGTTNQPRAQLTASKSGSKINFSVTRNSYCNYYMFWNGFTENTSNSDVYYAALAALGGEKETIDYSASVGWYYEIDTTYPYSLLITLGYTSAGVNSGIVDVKIINNSSGAVVRSAEIDLRSLSPEDMQMLKSADLEGKLVKEKIKYSKE